MSPMENKKWHRPFKKEIGIGTPYGVKGNQWKKGFHEGDDFLAPFGSPVEAGDTGTVAWAGDGGDGFGRYVRLDHPDGTRSYYPHLSEIHVAVGDVVEKEQIFCKSGNSGNVWHEGHRVTEEERKKKLGAHFHFQVKDKDGNSFKPLYEEA